MKNKKKLLGALTIFFMFSLSSCNINLLSQEKIETTTIQIVTTEDYTVPTPMLEGNYDVTFVCNNGYTYSSKTTSTNKILEPENPTKECATFVGWYTSNEYKDKFDFSNSVTEDTILYAKWNIDYVSLFNKVSTEYITSNVRIFITNYDKSGFPMSTMKNATTSLGSGVIFHENYGYYYALTNNHVVYTKQEYQDLTVEDAYETEYTFDIIASSAEYDLAIIRFRKQTELKVLNLANYEVPKGDLVFAMGEPGGLSNTISMGYILGSKVFTPEKETLELSNVQFNVYLSSAPIDSGSSGGALIDSNLKLVGINFASGVDKDTNEFKYTYTIPIDKVKEYVTKYIIIE